MANFVRFVSSKTYYSHCMVGTATIERTATLAVLVIYNTWLVVFNAFINTDRDRDGPLAYHFLKIDCPCSLPSFESINFKSHVSLLCVQTLILSIFIGIWFRCCQPFFRRIVEWKLTSTSQTSQVRQKVAINQLLFRKGSDIRVYFIFDLCVQSFYRCNSWMSPTWTASVLLLWITDLSFFHPINVVSTGFKRFIDVFIVLIVEIVMQLIIMSAVEPS